MNKSGPTNSSRGIPMCDPAVTRYLFPVEVRGVCVYLVMHGGPPQVVEKMRSGIEASKTPHVVVLYPATAPEVYSKLGSLPVYRGLSQANIEVGIASGRVPLIELETLHFLATEMALLGAVSEDVDAAINVAGPEIAKLCLSVTEEVTSKLLAMHMSPLPVGEGDEIIARAIAERSVTMHIALERYCRSFVDFLSALLIPDNRSGIGFDTDFYAASVFLNPRSK